MGKYIVMMNKNSWRNGFGGPPRYRKIALVELEDGFEGIPKMISERARGLKKIIEVEEDIYWGTGDGYGTQGWKAYAAMMTKAKEHNEKHGYE